VATAHVLNMPRQLFVDYLLLIQYSTVYGMLRYVCHSWTPAAFGVFFLYKFIYFFICCTPGTEVISVYCMQKYGDFLKSKSHQTFILCAGMGSPLGKSGPLSPSIARHHAYITCNCGQAFPSLSLLEAHMARTHPDNTSIVSHNR
jgi:hypothetical protein